MANLDLTAPMLENDVDQINPQGQLKGILTHDNPTPYDVVIIGAGLAGIGVGYKLQKSGITNFVILESASEVGGTWYYNSYPGCACDVPAIVYSYSFKQSAKWSDYYPSQPELLQYIKDCVVDLKLTPYLRLNHKVQSTTFDSATGLWTTRIHNQPSIQSSIVLACTGALNLPRIPNFPGRDTFQGASWHTARWDHNFDLKGKRVGLIGTGQSAIQVVKPLADVCAHLTIFQRSPCYIAARNNRAVPRVIRGLFTALPIVMYGYRFVRYLVLEGLTFPTHYMKPYTAILAWRLRQFRNAQIKDDALRAAVTPDDPPGCKRLGINDDYYAALQRPNVTLVPRAVDRLVPGGIVDVDDVQHDVDVIVYATGFAGGEQKLNYEILGLDGVSLGQLWGSQDAMAYYGGCIPSFPNFFMVQGPNTFAAHNSAIHTIESQAMYIVSYVRGVMRLQAAGLAGAYVDVKESALTAYNAVLSRTFEGTVYSSSCDSWYRNKNGKNIFVFPDGSFNFRRLLKRGVGWGDFEVGPEGGEGNKVWKQMSEKRDVFRGVKSMKRNIFWGWIILQGLCFGGLLSVPMALLFIAWLISFCIRKFG